jgi:hypothetical protein
MELPGGGDGQDVSGLRTGSTTADAAVAAGLAARGSPGVLHLGLGCRPADDSLVVDFKTHEIDAEQAVKVAQEYAIQVRVYQEAARIRSSASLRLFFTNPGIEVEAAG